MDRLIYTAAAGARALMQRQDGLSQNLANANTPGFRADQVAFRAVPVRGEGATTRVVSLEATAGFDDRSGPIQSTGRNLDVALRGAGYIAVQSLDGTEAYTRHGGLQVSAEGVLVAHDGLPVAGEGGALEEANIDLTQQLVDMITAQRAYQANAQTIKTQDQMMSTLVNLR